MKTIRIAYKNENKPESWGVQQTIATDSFITQTNGKIPLTGRKLDAGYYRITITYFDSASGKSIREIQHITLLQNNHQLLCDAAMPFVYQPKK